MQILLQDKYNIGVLTENIEFMWLGTKRMEKLAKPRLCHTSKPRHINPIFTVNTKILYIILQLVIFCHNKWDEINCCFIMTVAY